MTFASGWTVRLEVLLSPLAQEAPHGAQAVERSSRVLVADVEYPFRNACRRAQRGPDGNLFAFPGIPTLSPECRKCSYGCTSC